MIHLKELIAKKPVIAWALFLGTIGIGVGAGLLLSSITTRKAEAEFAYMTPNKISETEPRNEVWGANFPREFESYYQTQDTSFKSKYNGNKPIDMLAVDPRLVVLWAGYAFSKEYKQGRGHYYAVEDVRNVLRTGAPNDTNPGPQPGTCWTCKSPDVPRLMAKMGAKEFYHKKWSELGPEVVNSIGCADCHDAKTMALRITRPALVEAYQNMGKDITKATHQEMRSLVCAQCHVEYYFQGKEKYLVFPWTNGFTVENMEAYYDSVGHTDWVHSLSKTPMLKAQHPDFEIFKMGIHAERGLSCADCHMPYRSEGGQKFTDHHIQSPLNNVANSCQVCHREEATTLIKNVNDRQDKIIENRDRLEVALVKAHVEAKAAWDKGIDSVTMAPILQLIRKAQWRWDFVAASHGASFHAPVETSRIIGDGIQLAQEARVHLARILTKLGIEEVAYPDIGDKDKAQKFIGLDIPKLNAEKQVFLNTVVPQWLSKAKAREAGY
jgi:nitrite reductase (cytochrome c-552)